MEVKREQLPLSAGYVKTAHGVQGATLPAAIIDLAIPSGGGGFSDTYVPLSRVKRLEDLAILRPFEQSVLQHRLDPDIVADHQRLGDATLPGASIDLTKYGSCKRKFAVRPRSAVTATCPSSGAPMNSVHANEPALRSAIADVFYPKNRLFDNCTAQEVLCDDPFSIPAVVSPADCKVTESVSSGDQRSAAQASNPRADVPTFRSWSADILRAKKRLFADCATEAACGDPFSISDASAFGVDGLQFIDRSCKKRRVVDMSSHADELLLPPPANVRLHEHHSSTSSHSAQCNLQPPTPPFVEWGLANPDGMNICYANSLLRFLGRLLLPMVAGQLPKRMTDRTACVSHLLSEINTRKMEATKCVTDIAWKTLHFAEYVQQDPGELFQRLLDRLNDEGNRLTVLIQFPIHQVKYEEEGSITCEQCGIASNTVFRATGSGYFSLNFQIPDNRAMTVRDLLAEAASHSEHIPSYECETCGKTDKKVRTRASRTIRFLPKSNIQIYQLPRIQEPSKHVFRRGEWSFVVTDDVAAILCHEGRESLHSGHYFTFVRHPNTSTWRCHNDAHVSDGPLPDSALRQAYFVMTSNQSSCPSGGATSSISGLQLQ